MIDGPPQFLDVCNFEQIRSRASDYISSHSRRQVRGTRRVHTHDSMSANRTSRFDGNRHRPQQLPKNSRGSQLCLLRALRAGACLVARRGLACRWPSVGAGAVNRSSARAAPCRSRPTGSALRPTEVFGATLNRNGDKGHSAAEAFAAIGERFAISISFEGWLHDPPFRTA